MTVINIDEVVRALLPTEQRARVREAVDVLLAGFETEELEALCSVWVLDGTAGACAFLGNRLTEGRAFVRIRADTKRLRHCIEGHVFEQGVWYNVRAGFAVLLLREPASDLTPNGDTLFEARSASPSEGARFVL